jgi:hypothetical protein
MLTEIQFAPGIDKQDTSVGAQGRWVDSDLARFRCSKSTAFFCR